MKSDQSLLRLRFFMLYKTRTAHGLTYFLYILLYLALQVFRNDSIYIYHTLTLLRYYDWVCHVISITDVSVVLSSERQFP